MCGRMILTRTAGEIADYFEAALDELAAGDDWRARYNIAPSQDVAVVLADIDGARRLEWRRWGLVPSWAKDPSIGHRMINARSETAAEKPSFRSAFRKRRCLVPADGFYEWSGKRPNRQPHLFTLKSGAPLAIAGLHEHWLGEGGEVVDSCTLLTTDANATLAPFHDRMPVLLAPEDFDRWLSPATTDPAELMPLLRPAPDDWLGERAVSTRVNNPRHDDPDCIAPPTA